jgi:hypothetical protein
VTDVDPRRRRVMTGLAFSITLLVCALACLLFGTLLPPELAIWGPLAAGILLVASVAVFLALLIGLRRAR